MKSNEETYQKLTMREHILKRPGMYIGAIDTINDVLIVKGALQQVSYSPGLLKIFDEAIVNAIDHSNRTGKVTNIRVDIESDKTITITNDGPAIPIEVHKEHQCYIPEMIFTQFLTGSNYDDNQQRTVGGLNGLGIKLTSVFSKKFVIDILSANKHYYQEIYDNLTVINKPIIKNKKGKDYVKISFTPDFSRFPKNSIKDTYSLIESRIYDTCALTDDKVSVFLNGEKLKMKGFSNYLSIFNKKFISETITSGDFSWDIAVSIEPNEGFQQVSFVNGINTYKGGKHVDYIVNQITKSLSTLIETKKKVNIKPAYIKDRLFVIVKAVIVNPSFESQSKEALTTPSTKFGGKYSVSEKFIEKLYKTDIITDVLSFADYKAKKDLNKTTTTNTKKNKIYVKNLDDAIYAGTSKSQKCTLILTEGLSAKTFAVSGTSIIGREYYGIFALKGKCISEDTKVPLWNGQIKLAKDVEKDDIIIGDDGSQRTVLTLYKGTGPMYEISQDRGEPYKVNEDHLLTLCFPAHKNITLNRAKLIFSSSYWDNNTKCVKTKSIPVNISIECNKCNLIMTRTSLKRHYKRRHKGDFQNIEIYEDMLHPEIKKAEDKMKQFLDSIDDNNIFDISIEDYLKLPPSTQEKLSGVRSDCINWEEKPVELDPYVLGLFLGDGGKNGYQYTCHAEKDPQIMEYLHLWGQSNDATFKKIQSSRYGWSISSIENFRKAGFSPLKKLLDKYNLVNNKHIPKEYLINSKEIRLKLLAGIIDTDGYVHGEKIEIVQYYGHKQLAEDIVFLARSLGFFVYITNKVTSYKYKDITKYSEAYRISISGGNVSEIPTLLPRKKTTNTKYLFHRGTGPIKVKKIEDGAYVGIGVDNNNRFVINDFTVTHNCLNVREATQNQLLKNEEVNNIKKIIGLQHDKVYKDTSVLRYGSVMILTDSDDDGKHISGLIMNMFHYWWPELLDIPGFIVSMKTPIIKASNNKEVIDFYSVFDFTEWRKTNNVSKYNIKYYKGLGTSTAKEAKDVFKNMSQNVIKYIHKDKDLTNQAILLAFEKKKTDDRKEWLSRYESSLSVEEINNNVSFDDFINKELIHFSMADIHRSIPSMVDGLKPSQRKVLYTLIKKNYSKEIKVAQLGASVAEITSYHHGEASLYSTIINMAQDYVGSNNINLLKPNGQFGCLDPETPILLWSGYITPAKNIKVGDTLIGDDGFPRKVLKTTSGEDQMYRVFLPETNESFVVNKDHILTVFIPVHKEMVLTRLKDRIIGNEKIFTWDNVKHCFDETIVENTQSFISLLRNRNKTFDIRVEDYLSLSKEIKELLFTIKLNKPILWDKSEEAMYLVDPESIFFYIQKGYMNFIPKTYIKASIKNREKLLKSFLCIFKESLYITKSHIRINIKEITSVISSKILDQITFVWQSLGINVKQTNENYFIYTREYYKYIDKTSSLEDTLSLRYFKMEVSSIGKGKFVGWEVDCNKRFILGNFIVTHNSRISNGKDAASPRYIFTEINDITKKIYNNVDNNLLNYLEDEGNVIEPEYYVPIIPMILVNGASGIGTAYSTNIPCYNPKDIIDNMVLFIKNQPLKDLQPWYKGFKGRCIDNILYGVFKVDKNKIVVSELPLTSINDYTDFIENMITEGKMGIKEYLNYSTETTVNITLIFDTVETVQKLIQGDPYRVLKLTKNISINNMHLFDANGRIKKYDTPNDILKDFTKLRLKYNLKRKQYLTSQYNGQISLLKNKIRFIMGIINEDFVIYKKSKKDIINILETLKFEKIEGNYDYLLDMKMTSFSKEKIEELEKKLKNNEQLLLEISNKNEKQILVEDLNNLLN